MSIVETIRREITLPFEPKTNIWEIPQSERELKENRSKKIHGTLVLDIDGTLTKSDDPYDIDKDAMDVLAEFLTGGGNIVFCTGATLTRIENTVLTPLYRQIKTSVGPENASQLFEHVVVMPENGSALLLNNEVYIEENELRYRWYRIHELHTPNKNKLRKVIEDELIPIRPGSYIGGDHLDDRGQRDYILSWKAVSKIDSTDQGKQPTTRDLVRLIEEQIAPNHKEIDWKKILMWPARTTIDFVNADSGKNTALTWMLKELAGLGGPILGFGDLGDEFANVVPTINVNKKKPNEFRTRGNLPAMDLNGKWVPLCEDGYVITGKGAKATVRNRETDKEITVLRDDKGAIIYAATYNDDDSTLKEGYVIIGKGKEAIVKDKKTNEAITVLRDENGEIDYAALYKDNQHLVFESSTPVYQGETDKLTPVSSEKGCPIEIKPVPYDCEGITTEIGDAGQGTAWTLRKLIDSGYFN